jgi:hypothetical protein
MRAMSDVVKNAMRAALRDIDEHIEQEAGWDVDPSLWVVARDLTKDGFGLWFMPVLQGHAFVGEGKHPSDVLAEVADAAQVTKPPLPENLFAVAFISEAWAVMNAGPEADQLIEPRRLHTHKDRQEIRVIGAVDLAGIHYTYARFRDSEERVDYAARPSEAHEVEGVVASGYVLESLERLLEACL